jgi:hypothetical protein
MAREGDLFRLAEFSNEGTVPHELVDQSSCEIARHPGRHRQSLDLNVNE